MSNTIAHFALDLSRQADQARQRPAPAGARRSFAPADLCSEAQAAFVRRPPASAAEGQSLSFLESLARHGGRGAAVSITATRFFTDFCTSSKARTPIWRTRSRETPSSRVARLVGRRACRPGDDTRRKRGVRRPPQGPRLGALRAQRPRAADLRGAPARRRTDHALASS